MSVEERGRIARGEGVGRESVVLRAIALKGREEGEKHCVQIARGTLRATFALRENIMNRLLL